MHPICQSTQKTSRLLIKEETLHRRRMLLTYRLWSVGCGRRSYYLISITGNGDTAEARASSDAEIAMEEFRTVVKGTVTPCTLEDVLADYEFDLRCKSGKATKSS